MCRWANDPRVRHLHRPVSSAEAAARHIGLEEAARALRSMRHRMDVIVADGEPVGTVSLKLDAPELHRKAPGSGWVGLVIGEPAYWRRGLGTAAMQHIERAAREAGARRIELGVFEFNHPARALYARLGYEELARIPDVTYWDGRFWTELRLEKDL